MYVHVVFMPHILHTRTAFLNTNRKTQAQCCREMGLDKSSHYYFLSGQYHANSVGYNKWKKYLSDVGVGSGLDGETPEELQEKADSLRAEINSKYSKISFITLF